MSDVAPEDLQGWRLPNGTPLSAFSRGDYGRTDGAWWVLTPDGIAMTMAPVAMHVDRTISGRAGEWTLSYGHWSR
jgi:hypothetical protein